MYNPRSFAWLIAGAALLSSGCRDEEPIAAEQRVLEGPQFSFEPSFVESRVTDNPAGQQRPRADGDYIVYADNRHGNMDVFLYDATTGAERRITTHSSSQERPSISGSRIVWQDSRHGNADIYMFDLSTNTETRLTTNTAGQTNPDIDGDRVVWTDGRSGSQAYLLQLGGTERFVGALDDFSEHSVRISGDWVIWTGGTIGDSNVRARNIVTNELREIELGPYNAFAGDISYPWIAYDDASGGAWHPTAYNLITGEYVELPNRGQPEAAIGGDVVAYRIDFGGAYSIRAYDLSERREYVVSSAAGFQFAPSVSNDGRRVVWQDDRHAPRSSNYDIFHFGPPLPVPNRAPTAAIQIVGAATRDEGASVSFTTEGTTDPDGDALTYAWDFGNGSPALSGDAMWANVAYAFPDNGSFTVRVTVTDPDGLTASATVPIAITNVAPTATFNAPPALPQGATFQISLSAPTDPSEPDRLAGFTYAFDCGNSIFVATGATSSRSCTVPPNTNILVVQGRITDKDGASRSYNAMININNVVPTATFSASSPVDEGSSVSLSLSNPQDSPNHLGSLRYAFDCGSGYGALSSTPTASCPTSDNGTLNVKGKVVDAQNAFSEYTASVTINNVAPSAVLSAPASANEGGSFAFSLGNASDPSSVDAASLQFAFACGDAEFGAFGATASASCTAGDGPSTVSVRGRVRDKDGAVREYAASVNVVNVAPTATGISAPASVNEGGTISFAVTGATDVSAADAATLQFAFACNGAAFGPFGAQSSASCPAIDGPASATIAARVRDKDGGVHNVSTSVNVLNVAPMVDAGLGGSVMAGMPFTLRGTFGDAGANDGVFGWRIDWGDGSNSEGSAAASGDVQSAHAYAQPGTYTARLTVTDKDGASSSDVVQITVTPALVNVTIDIKPGSNENPIKLNENGNGKIPVAVLSGNGFDARSIDVASATLGDNTGRETAAARTPQGKIMFSYEDVDGDSDLDLVLHFERAALIANGDLHSATQRLTLNARLADGRMVRGSDVVRVM